MVDAGRMGCLKGTGDAEDQLETRSIRRNPLAPQLLRNANASGNLSDRPSISRCIQAKFENGPHISVSQIRVFFHPFNICPAQVVPPFPKKKEFSIDQMAGAPCG